MAEKIFDCIVIGKGLIGSAAAKYLARELDSTLVIGPDEPDDWKKHDGVFASHYDSGRITRILDGDRSLLWAKIARSAIGHYREIETESGIKFFHPKGCVKVAPPDAEGKDYIDAHQFVADKLNVNCKTVTIDELLAEFPYLQFPEDSLSMVEYDSAGWINPLLLIKAQLDIARKNGAQVVLDTVTKTERLADGTIKVNTDSGNSYAAKKILITAGAFSNLNNLTEKKLDLSLRGETILMAEISEATREKLSSAPSIIWAIWRNEFAGRFYIVPPAPYPDGKTYIKIGSRSVNQLIFKDMKSIVDWFHTEGQKDNSEVNKEVLAEIFHNTEFLSWKTRPCIITDTPSTHPYIGELESSVFIACGGNGYGAKSSDELGRIASLTCMQKDWDEQYRNYSLAPVFK